MYKLIECEKTDMQHQNIKRWGTPYDILYFVGQKDNWEQLYTLILLGNNGSLIYCKQ